jgi:nicotinamidase-related amidase
MADSPVTVDPAQCALLIMDYQPVVLDPMPDGHDLVKRTAEALAVARSKGIQVGYVRVAFEELDYAAVPETNKAFSAVAAHRFLRADEPATAVHDDLAAEPGDIVERKTRVGPFLTTHLDERLTNRGITTLIVAGVHTSGVVLSTVRDAADRDYRLYLLADCISDPDAEVHDLLMHKIFPRQAEIITSRDLAGLFGAA